jgi:hypothetical protein
VHSACRQDKTESGQSTHSACNSVPLNALAGRVGCHRRWSPRTTVAWMVETGPTAIFSAFSPRLPAHSALPAESQIGTPVRSPFREPGWDSSFFPLIPGLSVVRDHFSPSTRCRSAGVPTTWWLTTGCKPTCHSVGGEQHRQNCTRAWPRPLTMCSICCHSYENGRSCSRTTNTSVCLTSSPPWHGHRHHLRPILSVNPFLSG